MSMNTVNSSTIVWLVLVSLTLFAFLLGWLKLLSDLLVVILLVSTLLKGQLVIDYFMDLRQVKLRWRMIPTIWLIFVLSLIYLAYSFPKF